MMLKEISAMTARIEASSATFDEQEGMLEALRQSACKVPATCSSTLLIKVSMLVDGLTGQDESEKPSSTFQLAISLLSDLQAMSAQSKQV